MREAIAFHLEGLREQGEPVRPRTALAAATRTTPAAWALPARSGAAD